MFSLSPFNPFLLNATPKMASASKLPVTSKLFKTFHVFGLEYDVKISSSYGWTVRTRYHLVAQYVDPFYVNLDPTGRLRYFSVIMLEVGWLVGAELLCQHHLHQLLSLVLGIGGLSCDKFLICEFYRFCFTLLCLVCSVH